MLESILDVSSNGVFESGFPMYEFKYPSESILLKEQAEFSPTHAIKTGTKVMRINSLTNDDFIFMFQ